MPSNISFLKAAREKPPWYGSDYFASKVRHLLPIDTLPVINAANSPVNYHEGWLPDSHDQYTLPKPFQVAQGGAVGFTNPTSPPIGGANASIPYLRNTQPGSGDGDCHTNQYNGDSSYRVALKYPNSSGIPHTDAIIWEVSVYVRGMTYGNSSLTSTTGRDDPRRVELFLFGADAAGNAHLSEPWVEVSNMTTTLSTPASGYWWFFTRKTDVYQNSWSKLEMFVKFHPDPAIQSLTMRVDCDTKGTQIAIANPRLQPHHISLNNVLSTGQLSAGSNFSFNGNLNV